MNDKHKIKKISHAIEIIDSISEKSSENYPLDKEKNKISKTEPNYENTPQKKSKERSKKKLYVPINLDTIVYDTLLGPVDNKNRTYDKITTEIKKIENKNESEKSKLEKQINQLNKKISDKENKNKIEEERNESKVDTYSNDIFNDTLSLEMKKLMLLELERDKKLNYIEVIKKIKIPPEKRKIRDIIRIKAFLSQSKFGNNLKEEISDMFTVEKLINFCCIEMKYEKFKKGDILYKIGDVPHFFYCIIFGQVNILKPVQKHVILTGFQYFSHLMKLKKNKEKYMFSKCIKSNKVNFNIEENDAEIIHYVYLINYLDLIKNKNNIKLELDKVLEIIDIKPEELGINENMINSHTYINDNIKSIKKKIPHISEITLSKYSFINNIIIKKEIIIYEYKKISSLKSNDYFGHYDIENHLIRNETVIAEVDTEIAYLPNLLYYNQIASLKAIELENKMYNLHTNFFFNKIKYSKFSKKYFKLFIKENFTKDDILFNEDEEIKYLYFIKEGNMQLYTTKSMCEIEKLINLLIEKKCEKKEKGKETTKNNYYSYNQLNSQNDDIVNYINKKHTHKLMILNNNEDIGTLSYYLGRNFLTSCIITSNTAKIYKLDIKYMKIMLNNEYEFREEYINRMKKKMELLSERLFKINNIKLILVDDKIINEKNQQKEKNKISTQNNNNKTIINYDKISNLLNDCKNNNSYLNLPPLNTSVNEKNIKKSFIDNNQLNNSYFNKKNNSLKKKELIIEDSFLKRINEEIKYFNEDKYTISKDKLKLRNKTNSIKSYKSKKTSNINCGDNSSFSRNEEKEIFNNSNNNTISASSLKKSKMPKIVNYKNNYEIKSLYSNESKNNIAINLFAEKLNRIKNKRNKEKYNHPFYEWKTLFKKEKYKIFERNGINNELQNELITIHDNRLKDLKRLHLSMQKSHNYKNKFNTLNN